MLGRDSPPKQRPETSPTGNSPATPDPQCPSGWWVRRAEEHQDFPATMWPTPVALVHLRTSPPRAVAFGRQGQPQPALRPLDAPMRVLPMLRFDLQVDLVWQTRTPIHPEKLHPWRQRPLPATRSLRSMVRMLGPPPYAPCRRP